MRIRDKSRIREIFAKRLSHPANQPAVVGELRARVGTGSIELVLGSDARLAVGPHFGMRSESDKIDLNRSGRDHPGYKPTRRKREAPNQEKGTFRCYAYRDAGTKGLSGWFSARLSPSISAKRASYESHTGESPLGSIHSGC